VRGQRHTPATLYPPGKTRYPLYRRLGGPQGRSGQEQKISPPPGFDVVTIYTDTLFYPSNIICYFCQLILWNVANLATAHTCTGVITYEPALLSKYRFFGKNWMTRGKDSSSPCTHWQWGPYILLAIGYQELLLCRNLCFWRLRQYCSETLVLTRHATWYYDLYDYNTIFHCYKNPKTHKLKNKVWSMN